MRTWLALGLACLAASAQEVVALRGARIETVTKGVIDEGVILIRDGKIAEVGPEVKVPAGATVIDARGRTVLPGLVDPWSRIGVPGGPEPDEGAPVPEVVRGRFGGGRRGGRGAQGSAGYRVFDDLAPFERVWRQVPRTGYTTLLLVPPGNGIAGQAAAVRPTGATREAMALVPNAAVVINFEANTTTKEAVQRALLSGRRGGRSRGETPPRAEPPKPDEEKKQAEEQPQEPPPGDGPERSRERGGMADPGLMGRVLKGEVPLFVACNSAAEVAHFVDCAESPLAGSQARVVVVAEGDAWMAADLLGARKWTVVVKPALAYEPNTRNRILPPRLFVEAGARVAFVPPADSVDGLEASLAAAAELVRAGLDRDAALRALTATAAEAIGLGDRVGAIEAGREASLLVFDQDPLSPLARVRRVLIRGETVWEQP